MKVMNIRALHIFVVTIFGHMDPTPAICWRQKKKGVHVSTPGVLYLLNDEANIICECVPSCYCVIEFTE
jgi:hypothetical protein